ncbi:unnamed protein product [Arctia plantaginis]|uniref:Uncharacterized protein n=1 Tax=Arctia plantaginis TaxID=874455 RepID=A0A8S1BS03_ARCPL|nr:unnamed protein product [Arctia plantaginis]
MNERKILFFILAVIVYCMYSVHMWFIKQNTEENVDVSENKTEPKIVSEFGTKNQIQPKELNLKPKIIPLFVKDGCSVLEVFTEKPPAKYKHSQKQEQLSSDNNTITVIGITVFLVILLINAILEAIQAKEDERAKRKLNPDGERRQSLAEFANKKPLRRESSRFGFQLFQIAESFVNTSEEKNKTTRRQARPYIRGESINSYLSEQHRKSQEGSAPASINEIPAGEPRLVKRQSVAKLFGMLSIAISKSIFVLRSKVDHLKL